MCISLRPENLPILRLFGPLFRKPAWLWRVTLLLAFFGAATWCRADRNLNHLGYALSFHDEFDGPSLNVAKWNVSTGYTGNNGELENYSTNDVYVTNGMLVLESDAIEQNNQTNYTSGKVTSAGKFDQLYGWFEWSGQIPAGQGFWPAYWMLNYVTWPPEMDVMETVGTATYCNTMSLHWGPLPAGCTYPWDCGHTENTQYCDGTDYSAGLHAYAVDWEPSGSTFYIDGVARYTAGYLGNCTNTMYLIMNTAVGGDWPGSPNNTTPFPAYNLIDYVRVFTPLGGRYPLLNPGFETGETVRDFDNWNTYDDGNIQSDPLPANARSGNRAVQIWGRYNGQDNTTGIYQDLWASGGETWQASVWGRNRPGDLPQGGNLGNFKLEFYDNAGNLLAQSMQTVLSNTSSTNYSPFLLSAVAPFATQRARIVMEYFQTANGAGSVNFDDAQMDLLLPCPNILTNGGFENGLSGWTPYGASWTNYSVNTSIAIALSGSNYFKVFGQSSGAQNFSGVYQDHPSSPGTVFTAEGGAYTLSSDAIGAGNSAWIEVTFRDASTNILALYRSAILDSTMPANTWVELPVTNQYNPSTYTLTGSVTNLPAPTGTAFVRYQVLFYQPPSNPAGSVYFDGLALAQAGLAGPPTLSAISPDGSAPFLSAANALTFTISSPTALPANAAQVLLNGLDVSSALTVAGTSNVWNVTLPGLAPNETYSATITASNSVGSVTTNLTFDTLSQGDLMIEAEDFDYSRGQFIDNPAPASAAAANSYFGRTGVNLIDENYVTYAGEHLYRAADAIATEVTSDFLRQKYYAAEATNSAIVDYDVGWWYGGAWMNYTRTFPAGNYWLYGRLAGGNGNYSVQLEQVTSGRGTGSQTTQLLGYCGGAGGGWQSWAWAPLLTTSGQRAVVALNGVGTLRAISSGNVNANFYLLTPAPTPPLLQAAWTGSNVRLSLPTQSGFSYLVLYKNSLTEATWKLLHILPGNGAVQLYNDATGGAQRFYTVLVQ
jgi:beta-glucanase (GH16 family)